MAKYPFVCRLNHVFVLCNFIPYTIYRISYIVYLSGIYIYHTYIYIYIYHIYSIYRYIYIYISYIYIIYISYIYIIYIYIIYDGKKTPVVPHGHRNTPLIAWKMHVSWDMPMTVTCGVRDGSGGGVHTETTGIYHLVI